MKTYRFIYILVIIAFILSACGAQAPAEAKPPLKVAWLVFNGYGPFFVAQGKGFFQKHGLQVAGVQVDATKAEFIDLAGNAADCALIVFSDAIPQAV
ncbi:MAG: hypothetical protein ABI986_03480, partial [Chloroflexota bacterium]